MITLAKTAGFCFGVRRAVEAVEKSLKNGKTATLGEIIHNGDVVETLKKHGARIIHSPEEANKDETVIIRSHGVPDEIYERFDKLGISYIDGTCPFVKRIHDIVRKKSAAGYEIIIIGDKNHSEVQGIAGASKNHAAILADNDALCEYLLKINENHAKSIAIVFQTTYNVDKAKLCIKTAEKYSNTEVFNTICRAVSERQKEADHISRNSDIMIVVGGKHSANTKKLYEICKENCPRTFLIENADELKRLELPAGISDICNIRAGITAGASAPAHIIKEVYNQMSEKILTDEEFNFEAELEASLKKLHNGDRVKGVVTAVNKTEAIIDIGAKQTGYVSADELTDDTTKKPSDVVKVGDELDFIVLKVNDAEGSVTLSKRKVDAFIGFDKIVKAYEEKAVLSGVVTDVVKGGVLATVNDINGIKVFIPASQAASRRDEKLDELKKKEVQFKIIEINEQKQKAVGSIKQVLSAEKEAAREKFWESVKVGDKFKGEVKSLTNYGAFVDLGGIDGMVHISELSWNRIKNPSEVVSVGDELEVYVKELDKENGRISLGYKKAEDDPFLKFTAEYKVGDVVDTKIVSITPFGAFAQIIPGIDGLIHISQVSEKRVANVKDVLSVGDEVKVKITEIDTEKKRISLSVRALSDGNTEADEAAE